MGHQEGFSLQKAYGLFVAVRVSTLLLFAAFITGILVSKTKQSGQLIFHTVFNGIMFQAAPSWEGSFQARQIFDGFQPKWI